MGAQDIYRLAGVPAYSYTTKSSSPLTVQDSLTDLSQLVENINYVYTLFPSDLGHLGAGTRGGGASLS